PRLVPPRRLAHRQHDPHQNPARLHHPRPRRRRRPPTNHRRPHHLPTPPHRRRLHLRPTLTGRPLGPTAGSAKPHHVPNPGQVPSAYLPCCRCSYACFPISGASAVPAFPTCARAGGGHVGIDIHPTRGRVGVGQPRQDEPGQHRRRDPGESSPCRTRP